MTYEELSTPSYIVDEGALKRNLALLHSVEERTGCKILLAQKAFSMFRVYPLIGEYLSGTTASGIYEALLCKEEMQGKVLLGKRKGAPKAESLKETWQITVYAGKETEREVSRENGESGGSFRYKNLENHVFEPAYKEEEMKELCEICDHIYFNSLAQLEVHRPVWEPCVKQGKVQIALRINPEYSTQEGHAIYDPCAPGSRLGIRLEQLPEKLPEGVTGLHMHTLCEQGVEPLIDTFRSVEERFGHYLKQISWMNLGGGHHITKRDYDVERLVTFLLELCEKYGFRIYLEPGEAIALNAGTLITRVLDVVETSDIPTLIVDASAACHMPDVLEMPYTPPLLGVRNGMTRKEIFKDGEAVLREGEQAEAERAEGEQTDASAGVEVRIASRTCLAGDVIGIYHLPECPKIGDIITFGDMAIYSMVKNNTFNGMALPDIVLQHEDGDYELVKRFGYEDFKGRLS